MLALFIFLFLMSVLWLWLLLGAIPAVIIGCILFVILAGYTLHKLKPMQEELNELKNQSDELIIEVERRFKEQQLDRWLPEPWKSKFQSGTIKITDIPIDVMGEVECKEEEYQKNKEKEGK